MRMIAAGTSLAFSLLLAAPMALAQPTPADFEHALTLRERTMYLTDNVAEPPVWAADGRSFHYRRTAGDGFEFVTYDVATGAKRPAFDHARLAKGLGRAAGTRLAAHRLPFAAFTPSADGAAIDLAADGKAWRCVLANYQCAAAPTSPKRPSAFGILRDMSVPADNRPHRSPDGRFEAYVSGDDLYVREVATGATYWRSHDGSPGDFYDPETIVWSPDSSTLAAYRVVPGYRREIYRLQSSPRDRLEPRLITQLYPKPGDRLDRERPVLFHVADKRQIVPETATFANPYQLSPIQWRADSRSIAFTYNERGHGTYSLVEVDAASGKPREVVAERADTSKSFVYAPRMQHHDVDKAGREIVWMSERDGWNHLYMVDGRTGRVRQLTKGPWVVREIVHVDDQQRRIIFAANGREEGRDPYYQHYYRIDFDGRNLTPLTTADAFHDVRFSPDHSHYVDVYSRTDMPPVAELRRTADGSLVAEIERGDISRLLAAGWKAPEPFVAKGRDGKSDIHGLIVRPRDFDPAKKYPVIENIYGAGFDQFVPKRFWPFGFHAGGDEVVGMQAQADMGFIVVQIDGMGTLHRSKAFHDVLWKNQIEGGVVDHILWHKAYAAKNPWYDISRVGIYGGSAGGQQALGALLYHPDFYDAAVAYNGCHDSRMDKTSWNEQWMGWPVDESYSRNSNIDNAHRLQGDLLLISGELDMNVDPAVSMQVADALIRANKDFEQLVVPGGDHGVGRSEEPLYYIQRRQFDFFVRKLRGETTPAWNRAAPAS